MTHSLSLIILAGGIAYIMVRTLLTLQRSIGARRYVQLHAKVPAEMLRDTSLIVPIYHEDPKTLSLALDSWIKNNPGEIILVLGDQDIECQRIIRCAQQQCPAIRVVNNPEHVKRKAMLKGYQCSTGRYIVFIDSDVMWRTHTLHHLLVPFTRDHKIGGVTGSLEVVQPNNLSTLLFSYQAKRLEFQLSQYFSAMHLPLSVLSGRTSAYRREAVEDAVRALVSDSFQGKPNASGDDVFLPRFLRRNGWKTWFQSDAVFTTSPPRNLHTFIRQTIRWSRGTTRQMISTILEPKQDKVRTLNSNISSNMDILNALLLVGALLVTLWGQPLLGLCLIVLSFLGSLLPLFFYDTKLFIRNGLAIAVYEHLIGFVRLYGVFTPWNESWLTR